MPGQPDRTHHNTRPDWVGPTSLVMEIIPIFRSPGPEYLRDRTTATCVSSGATSLGMSYGHPGNRTLE